jgi:hypothetical protein
MVDELSMLPFVRLSEEERGGDDEEDEHCQRFPESYHLLCVVDVIFFLLEPADENCYERAHKDSDDDEHKDHFAALFSELKNTLFDSNASHVVVLLEVDHVPVAKPLESLQHNRQVLEVDLDHVHSYEHVRQSVA